MDSRPDSNATQCDNLEMTKAIASSVQSSNKCLCGGEFHYSSALSSHMRQSHKYTSGSETFIYKECNKSFYFESDFKCHMTEIHSSSKCRICGRKFGSNIEVNNHMVIMHPKMEEHICSICSAMFASLDELCVHMRTHTSYNQCPICTLYLQKDKYEKHITLHYKERYKSPICSAVFSPITNLERHMATPAKYFPCEYCFYSFDEQSGH